MNESRSVSEWLQGLKYRNAEAARQIWKGSFPRLVGLLRGKLVRSGLERVARDEEDLALSALGSLFRGAAEDRYRQLETSQEFWRLLTTIAGRKVSAKRKYDLADKRRASMQDGVELDQLLSPAAPPDARLRMREALAELPDPVLRRIACLKLRGVSNADIARQLDCSVRTVERKLVRIEDRLAAP